MGLIDRHISEHPIHSHWQDVSSLGGGCGGGRRVGTARCETDSFACTLNETTTSRELPPKPHLYQHENTSSRTNNYNDYLQKLQNYYRIVNHQLIRFQSPTTGLFPISVVPMVKEAHVRESLYCASSIWALSQAFKRIDNDHGRTHELCQSAVKCMRGILCCWLNQTEQLEKFKHAQLPKYTLHSKFHLHTGEILSDQDYKHLQIDCVSLYLIFLVQMINSGLEIIFTTDEVNFVQNLVFYVERAYRTADYGMWGTGSKYNNGSSELNGSSIGMAKAALEAINGCNMFGVNGSHWSVVFIDIDAHYRNRTTFDTILPRQSASKNTDSALIPTVSWPAFAIHEDELIHTTLDKLTRKLRGKYGYKRFLRDGRHTVIEDTSRKFYRPEEIKTFENLECEWPIFLIYQIIDGVFRNDLNKITTNQSYLDELIMFTDNGPIIPKYYYVPADSIDAERCNPGSQIRLPCENSRNGDIFLWGQAVYIISQLLVDGLLSTNELDPIRRFLPAAERPKTSSRYLSFQSSPADLVIQVALISESAYLQQTLATYGIKTQTPHQVEPIKILPPSELAKAYSHLGVNKKLGLTGRPGRPIGGLGTAKIYRALGHTIISYPLLFQMSDFYLSQDMKLVLDDVKTDLAFLTHCWKLAGRPTFCMLIREDNIRGRNSKFLFELLAEFKRGDCNGIKVRLGRLQEFISTACVEHLDFLNDKDNDFFNATINSLQERPILKRYYSLTAENPESNVFKGDYDWVDKKMLNKNSVEALSDMLSHNNNPYCLMQILGLLIDRRGRSFTIQDLTIENRIETMIRTCSINQLWDAVRYGASLLNKGVDSLAPSVTSILVRGKQVTLGIFGHDELVLDKPTSPQAIKDILYKTCTPHDIIQAVLQQEVLLNVGKFISSHPRHFDGILKIRIGWIVEAIRLDLNVTHKNTDVNALSPSEVKKLLFKVLTQTQDPSRSILINRQMCGALNRVPNGFYEKVWYILERTPYGLKVAGYHLPQQPTLSDMTKYEMNFSLLVELMLSKIIDPTYRQIIVESLMVVEVILRRNKEVSFNQVVDMDKLVYAAVSEFANDHNHQKQELDDAKLRIFAQDFYATKPLGHKGTAAYICRVIVNMLLEGGISLHTTMIHEACNVS